jgi:hypothetical protein
MVERAMLEGATIIAHNGRGFDFGFVKEALHKAGANMEIKRCTMKGTLIYSMEIRKIKYRFIDSFNFFASALAKFPSAFSFDVKKGHFPHSLNTIENQGKILPWPLLDEFNYQELDSKARVSLIKDLFSMMNHYYPDLVPVQLEYPILNKNILSNIRI